MCECFSKTTSSAAHDCRSTQESGSVNVLFKGTTAVLVSMICFLFVLLPCFPQQGLCVLSRSIHLDFCLKCWIEMFSAKVQSLALTGPLVFCNTSSWTNLTPCFTSNDTTSVGSCSGHCGSDFIDTNQTLQLSSILCPNCLP